MNAVLTNEEFFDKLHPNKEFVNINPFAGGPTQQQAACLGAECTAPNQRLKIQPRPLINVFIDEIAHIFIFSSQILS